MVLGHGARGAPTANIPLLKTSGVGGVSVGDDGVDGGRVTRWWWRWWWWPAAAALALRSQQAIDALLGRGQEYS